MIKKSKFTILITANVTVLNWVDQLNSVSHFRGRCNIVTFGKSCVLFSYLNFKIQRQLRN